MRSGALNGLTSTFLNESEATLRGFLPASKADVQKLLDLIAGLTSANAAADKRIAYLESQLDHPKVPMDIHSYSRPFEKNT